MENTNVTIKNQTFGVEIELTGITRENAAQVIADYFGTSVRHLTHNVYDTYGARDNEGRTWKCMRDGSICCVDENGRSTYCGEYSCEVVTPILRYEDLESLGQIMAKLVEKGAVANSSTGIHVHVNADKHNAETLKALLNMAVGREGLLYEALQIGQREHDWCHKTSKRLAEAAQKASDLDELMSIWYSRANDNYWGSVAPRDHYNETRYHGVNLHSYFAGKGVEFRYFNGTTDFAKIEAYIQLCLAINAYAINNPSRKCYFADKSYSSETKAYYMKRFLRMSLGLNATEYKNVNNQLTAVWAQ